MKKKFIFYYLCLIPSFAGAYDISDKASISDVNKPITWSLAALSNTIHSLFHHHCTTERSELILLSDYIYKNKPKATVAEIATACKTQSYRLKPSLFFYNIKNGDCPLDGQQKNGYIQKSWKTPSRNRPSSCEYYLKTLIEKQNAFVDKYAGAIDKNAGLYVKKFSSEFGGTYQVIDFISNNKGDATKANVYLIDNEGKKTALNVKMHIANLGVNITTAGHSFGINNNSYVFPKYDVTQKMLELCQQIKTPMDMIAHQATELTGALSLDVKQMFCGQYGGKTSIIGNTGKAISEPNTKNGFRLGADILGNNIDWSNQPSLKTGNQTLEQCHTNLVLFQGELVTFDYLGHWLFGCMRQINAGTGVLSGKVQLLYDVFAKQDQASGSAKADGQASDDGVLKVYQDEGSRDAKEMLYFQNTQTKTPAEAIGLVKQRLVNNKIVSSVSKITKCWNTECKKTKFSQDYVSCQIGNKIYQYEFDDICNTPVIETVKDTYTGTYFKPGMK